MPSLSYYSSFQPCRVFGWFPLSSTTFTIISNRFASSGGFRFQPCATTAPSNRITSSGGSRCPPQVLINPSTSSRLWMVPYAVLFIPAVSRLRVVPVVLHQHFLSFNLSFKPFRVFGWFLLLLQLIPTVSRLRVVPAFLHP